MRVNDASLCNTPCNNLLNDLWELHVFFLLKVKRVFAIDTMCCFSWTKNNNLLSKNAMFISLRHISLKWIMMLNCVDIAYISIDHVLSPSFYSQT